MTYSLAYSPCPNDTYIFAALTNGLLDAAPHVEVVLDDVEALNNAAREGRYELTKVSYGAIPYLLDRYRILRAGGALGRGCGPLVIARPGASGAVRTLSGLDDDAVFAIPGPLTTAFALLRLALGRTPTTVEMRFDRIVDAVASGEVDAGLIIHESRFTYQQAGLVSLLDLGDWWERETGNPIPLGAILVRRDVAEDDARAIDGAIRRSLQFAREREGEIIDYVRAHAFEMNDDVMRAHIGLYVNEFSDDVGTKGIAAVEDLFAREARAGLIPSGALPEFV
ncbi:1,4-dihydroxy-6-naphtoate synthase [Vulcanimicrobium alpinum]|uniref:1,4-dihydroxy-6-naphtoate synthase n=1 Tax=Vulcanimicrobium alpinum TaxID=3016050 RepID=A0AAN2C966_UNVUL|nr:1,4-dihydroxy-6-naphthoate synthase [Vulcanimicrobium alpinum]BDE05668.1 1,4-dihydroxy-6-naphtoate synthase [Vulcanimicrobium alpinum]